MHETDDAPIDSARIHARVTLTTCPGGGWGETQLLLHDRELVVLARDSALEAFRRLPVPRGALPALVTSGGASTLRVPLVEGSVDLEVPLHNRDDVMHLVDRLSELRGGKTPEPAAVGDASESETRPAPTLGETSAAPVVYRSEMEEARAHLVGVLKGRRESLERDLRRTMEGRKRKKKHAGATSRPAAPTEALDTSTSEPMHFASTQGKPARAWADRMIWLAAAIALAAAAWVLLTRT